MLNLNKIHKSLFPGVVLTSALFSGWVMADPVVLPPDREDLVAVPPVFCFKVTGGDVINGGDGARIQFEILNWTGEAAHNVLITQVENSAGNTGGLFDLSTTPDPVNGWHIGPGFGAEVGQTMLFSEDPSGIGGELADFGLNPIHGFDLDLNNDLNFDDPQGPLPSPVDSGDNVMDGFILDFPDFGIYERIVLQWDLLDEFGQNVDTNFGNPGEVLNPFSFGTFQIDRASNGSVRVTTAFSIGTYLWDVPRDASPLDPDLTELNAITLPGTAVVPVPAAIWLFGSGLLGIAAVARKRRQLSA